MGLYSSCTDQRIIEQPLTKGFLQFGQDQQFSAAVRYQSLAMGVTVN